MEPLDLLRKPTHLTLLHDPSCPVSTYALEALQLGGHHPEVRRIPMRSEALSRAELRDLAMRLIGDPVDALVRRDARYAALGLRLDGADTETVVDVLSDHPELLQRPILDDGTQTMIGRPPERAEAWAITGHVIDTKPVRDPLLRAA